MSLTRKAPFVLILDNFDRSVLRWQTAIAMIGTTPYWTDERISDERNEVQSAGRLVRRMYLTPSERDLALKRLHKNSRVLKKLLTTHGRGTMNERWFKTLLKRVADQ